MNRRLKNINQIIYQCLLASNGFDFLQLVLNLNVILTFLLKLSDCKIDLQIQIKTL